MAGLYLAHRDVILPFCLTRISLYGPISLEYNILTRLPCQGYVLNCWWSVRGSECRPNSTSWVFQTGLEPVRVCKLITFDSQSCTTMPTEGINFSVYSFLTPFTLYCYYVINISQTLFTHARPSPCIAAFRLAVVIERADTETSRRPATTFEVLVFRHARVESVIWCNTW